MERRSTARSLRTCAVHRRQTRTEHDEGALPRQCRTGARIYSCGRHLSGQSVTKIFTPIQRIAVWGVYFVAAYEPVFLWSVSELWRSCRDQFVSGAVPE